MSRKKSASSLISELKRKTRRIYGSEEKIIDLKDVFPDGDNIWEIVFDQRGSTMAVQVEVENEEIWKLEGVFNE